MDKFLFIIIILCVCVCECNINIVPGDNNHKYNKLYDLKLLYTWDGKQ